MPDSGPRIPPLPESEWQGEALEQIERTRQDGRVLNIFSTLANHPKLMKRWLVFGNHVLQKSSLEPRERELVILRVGWLCRAEYEWSQHVIIAKACGISEAEIERIQRGPDAEGWDSFERALLRAADELQEDSRVSDATWKELALRYDTTQLMDLVFTIGQYTLVSMALNSFGVELEEGVRGFSR